MLITVMDAMRPRISGVVMMLVGATWMALLGLRVITIGSGSLPYGLRLGLGGAMCLGWFLWGARTFQGGDVGDVATRHGAGRSEARRAPGTGR